MARRAAWANMNRIEMLREALHTEKVAFDLELADEPTLTKDQRLARWELFLDRIRPLAQTLVEVERRDDMLRRNMALAHYSPALLQ